MRARFDNAASAPVVALHDGANSAIPAYAPCAPFLRPGTEAQPALLAILSRLMERAEALGWKRTTEAGLHFLVHGRPIGLERVGDGRLLATMPPGTRDLRLVSRAGRPCGTLGGSSDGRWLGVQLVGLSFTPRGGETRDIAIDDPAWSEGLHRTEWWGERAWRWTDGNADLGAALAPCLVRGGVLSVRLRNTATSWVAPDTDAGPVQERTAA